jgi:hypothetical protein
VDDLTLSLCVHGLAVSVRCGVHALRTPAVRLFGAMHEPDLPEGFSPVEGEIRDYDAETVVRHLSPTAQQVATLGQLAEIYQENERLWLVDDTWGLCEVNLLKRQWRSWVLPQCPLHLVQRVEAAIHWPMAQLLRPQGLHLLPAVSVATAGAGVLLFNPFSLEPELHAMRRLGFDLVAQRWSALREEEEGVALLSMPGLSECVPPPRLAGASRGHASWSDLSEAFGSANRHHAFCGLTLLIEPVRRGVAQARPLARPALQQMLRERWPIIDLTGGRSIAGITARLAADTVGWSVQLSRDADESARLIRSLLTADGPGQRPSLRAQVHVNSASRVRALAG